MQLWTHTHVSTWHSELTAPRGPAHESATHTQVQTVFSKKERESGKRRKGTRGSANEQTCYLWRNTCALVRLTLRLQMALLRWGCSSGGGNLCVRNFSGAARAVSSLPGWRACGRLPTLTRLSRVSVNCSQFARIILFWQRGDGSDSAYAGSQGSNSSCAEIFSLAPVVANNQTFSSAATVAEEKPILKKGIDFKNMSMLSVESSQSNQVHSYVVPSCILSYTFVYLSCGYTNASSC